MTFDWSLSRFLRNWRAAVQARREARRLAAELGAYSDRELSELGLARSDIGAVVRGVLVGAAR